MSTIITRAGKGSALTHNQLDANFKQAAQAKTTAYTVAESDNRDTIECSGTFSVTLPDAAAVVAAADTGDFQVAIKNTGTGVITIARTTALDTIDGTAADTIVAPKACITLKCSQSGAGYIKIGDSSYLGTAQTWEVFVGSSRSLGTPYTNNTGRPIVISVIVEAASGGARLAADLQVDGSYIAKTDLDTDGGAIARTVTLTATVPHGSTYQANALFGIKDAWWELR